MTEQKDLQQWLALRREAGLLIDPATAEVDWNYGVVGDPYNIGHVPKEEQCIGRQYFARAPGSDIWVTFGDLPAEVKDALWQKHKANLAFPAGLPVDVLRPGACSGRHSQTLLYSGGRPLLPAANNRLAVTNGGYSSRRPATPAGTKTLSVIMMGGVVS